MITNLINTYKYYWVGGYSLTGNEQWFLNFSSSSLFYNNKEVRSIKKYIGQAPQFFDEEGTLIHVEEGLFPTFQFVLLSSYNTTGLPTHYSHINEIVPSISVSVNDSTGILIQNISHYGETYEIYFVADVGYSLVNAPFTITMGGNDISNFYDAEVKTFTYEGNEYVGTHLLIPNVTDDVIIDIGDIAQYDIEINFDGEGKGTTTFPMNSRYGEEITGEILSAGGYSYKEQPRVIRGTTDITNLCNIEKTTQAKYTITIPANEMYQDINIVSGLDANPSINATLEHCTINIASFPYDRQFAVMFTIDNGYYLDSEDIELYINNERVYDFKLTDLPNDRVRLNTINTLVTGEIVINAIAKSLNRFDIRNKDNQLVGTHYAKDVKKVYITRNNDTTRIVIDDVPYEYQEVLSENEVLKGLTYNYGSLVVRIPYGVETALNLTNSRTLYEVVTTLPTIPTDFKLYLYKNSAEHNQVDKTSYLESVGTIGGTLRKGTTIVNPVIDIEMNDIPTFNYVHIPLFNRYYYVEDIQSINNKYWGISLRVDVLMSYKDIIRSQTALIGRNENEYNEDLIDERRVYEATPNIEYVEIPNTIFNNTDEGKSLSVDKGLRYVLTCVKGK